MVSHRVVYGIPGSGKTTFGTMLAGEWFKEGCRPEEVAYLAFTRAAAKAAAVKIFGSDDEVRLEDHFPYFRTIHSLSYLGLRGQLPEVRVLTPTDMKRFSKEQGFEGVFAVSQWEDLADVYRRMEDSGRTEWDRALTAYSLSRITAGSVEDLDRARVEPSQAALMRVGFMEAAVYQVFVQKYEAWKKKEGLIDFTDMLEFALRSMAPLDQCRKVIVDEAQDLCPLHHAIMDKLFRGAEEMVWIGDDDQAIFLFSGASSDLFLKRARAARFQMVLQRTNRYGQEIVDFSQQIIRRVADRQEKEIQGVPGRGASILATGRFEPVHGKVFILHRHVQGCQAAAEAYIEAGLPFRNERGKDPLGSMNRIKAWTALDLLSRGESASSGLVQIMIEELLPSVMKNEERTRLVVHGAKKKLELTVGNRPAVTLKDLIALKVLTEDGAGVVKSRRYDIMDHARDLEYYERVSKNGHALDGKGSAVITTIHGSKGRQAKEVFVFSQMGRKCWADPDTEHRLAYVAATRTESSLTVCQDELVDWAETKYQYPVGGGM